MTEDLKFDKMDVDTKRAEKYLEKYKDKINKPLGTHPKYKARIIESERVNDRRLPNVANMLEDEMDLFCQLEYLINKIPIQVTKLNMETIIKNLRNFDYVSSFRWRHSLDDTKTIVMSKDTPLTDLGWVAQREPVKIVATDSRAAVCSLFKHICHVVCNYFVEFIVVPEEKLQDHLNNSILKNNGESLPYRWDEDYMFDSY